MKKRKLVLALMLSLMMLVTMIPSFSFADETGGTGSSAGSGTTIAATSGTCGATGNESNVTWSFDKTSGTLTISGTGPMADYTVNGTGDDRPWKDYAESITKVQISEGVTSLGKSAFQNLTALKETNIPASITQLGDHIYRGDASLTTVNWAEGFTAPKITDTDSNTSTYSGTYVPTSMFDGCTSLGADQELSTWLPESFTGVGCAAFRGTAFKVDFEKWTNLGYIGARSFEKMPNLDAVTVKSNWTLGLRGNNSCAFIGSGVKSAVIESRENIPWGLFQDCASLTSVTLPDDAKTIGLYAFAGTTALESIDLKNVETISDYAFSDSGIEKLVFPESLKKVEDRAFCKNKALTKLTINSSNLEIKRAFMGCSALSYVETSAGTNVTFNSSFGAGHVTAGETACTGVKKLVAKGTIDGSIAALTGLEELTVNGSSKTGLTGNTVPESVETLTITDDQWQMGNYVFAQHPKPKNLVVTAKKVTPQVDEKKEIAKATFRSNLTLETAQFTGDDVTLNQQMFLGCSNLKQLDLSKVKTLAIGSGCFGDDMNTEYTGGSENPFNTNCNIYVDSAEKVNTVRTGTGLKANSGIVLVVNGGTVEMGKTGFDSVTKKNHYAEWYEDSKCEGDKVTAPKAGKTYYAKWIEKEAQEISFEKDAVTVHANKKTVTNPINHTKGDGSVIYKSDKENVATVDATTGEVTIVGAGTATITATAAETGNYKEASASYNLTVTQHEFRDQWSSDENNHWHACKIDGCDAKSGSADHEFKWVVDKEATTTEKGSKHEECTVCGYEKAAVEIPVIESGTIGGDQNSGNTGNGTKADTANGAKTGDTMPIGMLAVLMLAAAAGIVFCGRKLYKSR